MDGTGWYPGGVRYIDYLLVLITVLIIIKRMTPSQATRGGTLFTELGQKTWVKKEEVGSGKKKGGGSSDTPSQATRGGAVSRHHTLSRKRGSQLVCVRPRKIEKGPRAVTVEGHLVGGWDPPI